MCIYLHEQAPHLHIVPSAGKAILQVEFCEVEVDSLLRVNSDDPGAVKVVVVAIGEGWGREFAPFPSEQPTAPWNTYRPTHEEKGSNIHRTHLYIISSVRK